MCKKWVYSLSFILFSLAICVQADTGLVASYSFENDANDNSGNGLNGTLSVMGAGNAATFVAGQVGMAIDLLPASAGTIGPYVDCGNDAMFDFTEAYSVGAWVNIRDYVDNWRGIVAKGEDAWRLMMDMGKYQVAIAGSARGWPGAMGATVIGLNEWHYICGTYDMNLEEANGKIYIDGVVDGTLDDPDGIDKDTNPVWIGGDNGDTGWKPYRLFDGQIDEVRIYSRALSADEVAALAGM